jgi:hypothetical protein
MLNTPVLRWGAPLLLTGVLLAFIGHHSPDAQVLSRYSRLFFILIVMTGCLAAAGWWVALSEKRYLNLLDQLFSLQSLSLAVILFGSIALLDLFIDGTRAVAWLPLPIALYLLWASRAKTTDTDARPSRLPESIGSIALVIGAVLFSVLVAEILFRTFLMENYVPTNDEEFEQMISTEWPRPIPRQREPGTYRILHLGDSFGQAGGRRNFQYVLEELFAEAGVAVEVVNFSRPGYEPLEQLALLKGFAAAYQPDLILHGFFVGNDFETPARVLRAYEGLILRPTSGLRALRPHYFQLRQWLQQYRVVISNNLQKAAEAARIETAKARQQSPARTAGQQDPDRPAGQNPPSPGPAATQKDSFSAPHPKARAARGARAADREQAGGTLSQAEFLRVEKYRLGFYAPGPPPAERWRETAGLLQAIRDEAARIGSDYLMVIHPDQLQVEPEVVDALIEHYKLDLTGYDLELPQRFLMQECSTHGIHCVNLLPLFKGRAGPLYLVRDTHYNHSGNRLAAEALYEKLSQTELFNTPP